MGHFAPIDLIIIKNPWIGKTMTRPKSSLLDTINSDVLRYFQGKNRGIRGRYSPTPTDREQGYAIREIISLNCDPFSDDKLEKLNLITTGTITRHYDNATYEKALEGWFKFGTLEEYRSKESDAAGRQGDDLESYLHEYIEFEQGIVDNYTSEMGGVRGSVFTGSSNHISREYKINDYVSCFSKNEFKIDRARKIRDAEKNQPEDKILTAYIVYDVEKLVNAIYHQASTDQKDHLRIIARNAIYRKKNDRYNVDGSFASDMISKTDRWLAASFRKPERYSAEEETRLMLIDPARPGGLKDSLGCWLFKSDKVAEAIVDHGHF